MIIGISTSVIQRGRSGVARYVLALTNALLAYAHRHQFVLFVLERDRALFDFAEGQMRIVSIAERNRPPIQDILWHQRKLPRLAQELGLDVMHVPSYRRLIHRAPCALVATIHDLAPFHLERKYDWARTFYGRVVARYLARCQDRVIAVSQTTAHDLQRFYGLPAEKVVAIPNGIEHRRFYPGDPRDASAWVARHHSVAEPFFLYVARLEHPAKNHTRLIDAFDRFKMNSGSSWRLVLGGSDWHGAEAIHARIRRSPFAHDIIALGYVNDANLPMWYRAAGAFIYPSLFEGFGLPPIEAMACGCPVLCSARGALAETVGEAASIIDPEDPSNMAQQMERAARDPEWRQTLRAAGLRHAQAFSWERTAEATVRVYESLVPSTSAIAA